MKIQGKEYYWREYQNRCFASIRDLYRSGEKGLLIEQATGTGKRAQAIYIASRFQTKPTLFLVHRESLVNQAYRDFSGCNFYGEFNVGIVKGTRFEIDRKVVVATPQTMINRLSRIPKDYFGCIQVDECHNYCSKTFRAVVEYFTPDILIGWTATPYRLDGLSLYDLFPKHAFSYDLAESIQKGTSCELEAIRIPTGTDISGVKKQMGDFNQKQLEEAIDTPERNQKIANAYLTHIGSSGATIGFATSIEHCRNLTNVFKDKGIRCEYVASTNDSDDNKMFMEAFENGRLDVLWSVDMLTEGYDFPDLRCGLNASPTQSKTRFIQRIGRVARLKSDEFVSKFGQKGVILDFVDSTRNMNILNSESLDKGGNWKTKIFIKNEDREKLQRTEEDRKRKHKFATEKEESINLKALPMIKQTMYSSMHEPATDSQITFMQSLGVYNPDYEYTKSLASEFINNCPAQTWQLRKVAAWGFDVSEGVTMGQYMYLKKKFERDHKFERLK